MTGSGEGILFNFIRKSLKDENTISQLTDLLVSSSFLMPDIFTLSGVIVIKKLITGMQNILSFWYDRLNQPIASKQQPLMASGLWRVRNNSQNRLEPIYDSDIISK